MSKTKKFQRSKDGQYTVKGITFAAPQYRTLNTVVAAWDYWYSTAINPPSLEVTPYDPKKTTP